MMSLSGFFEILLFLLTRLVTGPSFNIITVSGIITISFYEGLIRNTETVYPCLSFAQYPETALSREYQIWHERL